MATDYPYTQIVGQDADGGQVNVKVVIDDEYHLVDEPALVQTIRDSVDARAGIVSVTATRFDITSTSIPGA